MAFFYDREQVGDIDALIRKYPDKEFRSPHRSTVPLLSLIKHGKETWHRILNALGMSGDADHCVEFTVTPPMGRGKASHTDLMLRQENRAFAIESKWTEPKYLTIGQWLRGGDAANRRKVVDGWLSLLAKHAGREPTRQLVDQVVYQLLHRSAASCSGCESGGVAYLQFAQQDSVARPAATPLKADLETLAQALDFRPSFQVRLITVQLEPTLEFGHICNLPKGDEATAKTVRDALLNGPLFRFPESQVETVSGKHQDLAT